MSESLQKTEQIEASKLEHMELVTINNAINVDSTDLIIPSDNVNKQEILMSDTNETVQKVQKTDNENIFETDTHMLVQSTPSDSQQQFCDTTVVPPEVSPSTTKSLLELTDVVKDIIEESLAQIQLDIVDQKSSKAITETPASSDTIDTDAAKGSTEESLAQNPFDNLEQKLAEDVIDLSASSNILDTAVAQDSLEESLSETPLSSAEFFFSETLIELPACSDIIDTDIAKKSTPLDNVEQKAAEGITDMSASSNTIVTDVAKGSAEQSSTQTPLANVEQKVAEVLTDLSASSNTIETAVAQDSLKESLSQTPLSSVDNFFSETLIELPACSDTIDTDIAMSSAEESLAQTPLDNVEQKAAEGITDLSASSNTIVTDVAKGSAEQSSTQTPLANVEQKVADDLTDLSASSNTIDTDVAQDSLEESLAQTQLSSIEKKLSETLTELPVCSDTIVTDVAKSSAAESLAQTPLDNADRKAVEGLTVLSASSNTIVTDVVQDSIKESSTQASLDNVEQKTSESLTSSSAIDYAKHVTYKEDGSAIYTDPQSNFQYTWCEETNNWIPVQNSSDSSNALENEHYKWCEKSQKWIPKQTQVAETEHYKWDAEKNQWIPKTSNNNKTPQSAEIVYEIDEDGQRTYKDKDGTVFFWDASKNAWFPKIDEDFMARYQMSYGFIDNTSETEQEKAAQDCNEAKRKQEELEKLTEEAKTNDALSRCADATAKRKHQQEPPQWFDMDPARNTKVYVSNLPLDISMEEFAELMGKCGMIMRDPITQKFKLKLYTEADGQIKGDGLCDYIKVESVDLALKILDEYNLRGSKIRVQRARFQMRGEYNPALKPKRKKKDREKMAKLKEKLFDWRPEKMRGERSKHEKTVIIKNLFHPELFENEVQLILEYQTDLREECSKCGTVKKVVIYDRHSEGIAQVNMSSPEEADLVIQMMQGRFFGKRQLTAEHWDGKTKYKVEETQEETKERLNTWNKYLETTEQS